MQKANDLLGASYQLYRHAGTNETILRTASYALLAMDVKTVALTTYFGSPPRRGRHHVSTQEEWQLHSYYTQVRHAGE